MGATQPLEGSPQVRPRFPHWACGLLAVRVRAVGFEAQELPELTSEVAAQLFDLTELSSAGLLLSNGTVTRYVEQWLQPHERVPASRLRRALFDRAGTPTHELGAKVSFINRAVCGASVVAWSGRLAGPEAGTLRLRVYDAKGVLQLDQVGRLGDRLKRATLELEPVVELAPEPGVAGVVAAGPAPHRLEWPRWCVARVRLLGAPARTLPVLLPHLRREVSDALDLICPSVVGLAADGFHCCRWPKEGEHLRRVLVGPGSRRPAFELAQTLWQEQLAPALAAVTVFGAARSGEKRWVCKLYDGNGRRLQLVDGGELSAAPGPIDARRVQ